MSTRTTSPRAFSSAAARAVAGVLADGSARALSFGFDSPLVTRVWSAVKTGTSQDHRDNWCVGFTDRYTVGVWLGNPDGSPMHTVSGVMGAAPVWRQVVEQLHANEVSRAPPPEPGTRLSRPGAAGSARVARAPEPEVARVPLGIVSPARDSVWVVDPAMPSAAQRILLAGPTGGWWIGGHLVGTGARVWWSPRVGRHLLELRGPQGRVLDSIPFEVRPTGGPGSPDGRRLVNRQTG